MYFMLYLVLLHLKCLHSHCFQTQQGIYFVSICLQCTFIAHVSDGGSTLRD